MFSQIEDTDENRLYWMNNDGDIHSAKDDGSDVNILFSTHASKSYHAVGVYDDYIYYGNDNQLLMVTKSSGTMPTVMYDDTNYIYSINVFNVQGMIITIYNYVLRYSTS